LTSANISCCTTAFHSLRFRGESIGVLLFLAKKNPKKPLGYFGIVFVARTGILSSEASETLVFVTESRFRRFFRGEKHHLSLRFQTKANKFAFFLATKKNPKARGFRVCFCGQNWNRTSDTRIFSPLLYHLSYLAKKNESSYLFSMFQAI
jgi:hypothetical protein